MTTDAASLGSSPATRAPLVRSPASAALSVLCGLFVLALALMARTQGVDRFVTVDEDLTLGRTGAFADVLVRGRWQRTYQIGHPEVTVMWIGTLALQPEWARQFAGTVTYDGLVARTRDAAERPGFMDALARARLGMVVANSLVIGVASLLLWRIAGPASATFGGTLLALEPFLVAHGQLLRSDGLLSALMLVSVLAAAAYWLKGAGVWALALASAATGLALLTKTPAVLVLPVIGGMALMSSRRAALAPWVAGVAVVYVALWPAMWVQPLDTLEQVLDYTMIKGGSPMESGSFLLGEASADPGPLFYVAALGLRLSPLALLGLVALIWWRGAGARPVVLPMLALCLVAGAAVAIAPKKADRYMLPLVPPLIVLAGVGAAGATRRWGNPGRVAGMVAIVAVQGTSLLAVQPYALAYYNPLLGGGATASKIMLVGWGEGLDQVAAALNEQPDAAARTAAVFYPDTLDAQFAGRAVPLDAYDIADYAVRYIASDQRELTPQPLDEALQTQPPLLDVRLNGIPYARLYELADPEFAGGITLESVRLDEQIVERGRSVNLLFRWRMPQPTAEHGWRSRIVLLREGREETMELLGTSWPAALSPGQVVEDRYRFTAPNRLGRYVIALSVRSEADGSDVAVVRRPPGLDPSPTQLVFRSLWIRVQ